MLYHRSVSEPTNHAHRVRSLHAPRAPDPRVVQSQEFVAVEECLFHTPAPAISQDDELRRSRRIGRHQRLVPPSPRGIADQDHGDRIGLAPAIP